MSGPSEHWTGNGRDSAIQLSGIRKTAQATQASWKTDINLNGMNDDASCVPLVFSLNQEPRSGFSSGGWRGGGLMRTRTA